MEVEELSPLAQHFSLTPTKGSTEEDDGFVDILENDLKVNNLSPSGPYFSLPGVSQKGGLSSCSKTCDLISMAKAELEVTESQPNLWPIREEQAAGAAAVRGGWGWGRGPRFLVLCKHQPQTGVLLVLGDCPV